MRGLKSPAIIQKINDWLVALYMSAWIEILRNLNEFEVFIVALYMSAWIEIINSTLV